MSRNNNGNDNGPDEIRENDEFLVVDFSNWNENRNVGPDPTATPLEPTADEGDEEKIFIPESWRDPGFEIEVEQLVRRNFIQQAALDRVREIQHGKIELPPIYLLPEFLEQPDNPVRYSIEDLWPIGGNVLFAAAAKFGKSTVSMNLIRSLADGTAFLDYFAVDTLKADESVLLIDLEMNEDRVRSEIRAQGIQNQGCLHVVPMRGMTKQLDIFNVKVRKLWIDYCLSHNVRTIIIDPLAPLFGYLNVEENDNTGVNRFFQVLDEIKHDAGIRDLLVTHHCGHTADWRPRGASRFNDWPDALWLAKLDGDVTDPTAARLFFARGRDVGESFNSPGALVRDDGRRLTFTPDVSAQDKAELDKGIIENVVYIKPGLSGNSLFDAAKSAGIGRNKPECLQMFKDMESEGRLHSHQVQSKGNPSLWFVDTLTCPHCH